MQQVIKVIRQIYSSYSKSTLNSMHIHLINTERVSKLSVIILGLRAGLDPGQIVPLPPMEQSWVARSQHARCMETSAALYILQIIYVCSTVNDMPTFVTEEHMLDWHTCQICYPLEIKLLLLSLL